MEKMEEKKEKGFDDKNGENEKNRVYILQFTWTGNAIFNVILSKKNLSSGGIRLWQPS